MGLLDASYSAVNTKKPRKSDRILPATELNARGLLDAATNVPIAGDALSGVLAAYDAAKGDYGSAAMNALGVLPFVSAGMVKPTEKLFHGSLGKLDGELRKGTGTLGEGFYLTNKEKQAALYPKLHAMKQGIKNPDVVVTPMETTARNIYNFDEVGLPVGGVDSRKLQELGYDGATYNNELIVFDPSKVNQVKQSRPMTEYEKRHEIARQNAVKMLGLPDNNTAMDRARAMGYTNVNGDEFYGGMHRPPMSDSGAPAHDLTGGGNAYPDDVYSPMASRYYGSGDSSDGALFRKLQALKGKPEEKVRVFRAVPSEVMEKQGNLIHHGDWVTPNRDYAVMHGEGALNGDYRIQAQDYPAKALFTNGDSAYEFGVDKSQLFADGPASIPVMISNQHNVADRSRFAAFDPAKKHESDMLGYADPRLLGLIGGGGLLGLGAYKANQE